MIRVAVFIPGGVGDPASPMHVPVQVELIARLSQCFDMTVYSVIKPDGRDRPFMCGNAIVKFIRARYDAPKPIVALGFLRSFLADHRKKPFDLIHGFWALPSGAVAVLAGRIFRIPSIVSLQGGEGAALSAINYGNMRTFNPRHLTLWTCRHATVLTALTEFQRAALRSFGMVRSDVHVIPYGAGENFAQAFEHKQLGPPFRFLSVGHLNAVKDHATTLRAFQRISEHVDCRLRMIGDGPMKRTLQREAEELEIPHRVEFTGHVPHADLPDHFRWAHAMLHTARYEGQGVVIAEAAASGVVVCGSRVGLLADLEPRAAVAVDPGDDAGLAREVLSLLADPERFASIRDAARRWALEHPSARTAGEIQRLYELTVNV